MQKLGEPCGVTRVHLGKEEPGRHADFLWGNKHSWKKLIRVLEETYCISPVVL